MFFPRRETFVTQEKIGILAKPFETPRYHAVARCTLLYHRSPHMNESGRDRDSQMIPGAWTQSSVE